MTARPSIKRERHAISNQAQKKRESSQHLANNAWHCVFNVRLKLLCSDPSQLETDLHTSAAHTTGGGLATVQNWKVKPREFPDHSTLMPDFMFPRGCYSASCGMHSSPRDVSLNRLPNRAAR